MRRMFSENQIKEMIKEEAVQPEEVVGLLVGKDINVDGITSKGIANTGAIANIGNVAISGDLIVQGEGKGKVIAKTLEQTEANWSLPVSIPSITGFEGNGYYAIKKINGEIHLIFAVAYKNTSGEAKNFTLSTYQVDVSSLPTADREKIIDMSGKNLTEEPLSFTTIRMVATTTFADGAGAGTKPLTIKHSAVNELQFYWTVSFNNIPADGYVAISYEVNFAVL